MTTGTLQTVTKSEPCPHCGKPDWCYRIGELTVCKRDAEPAPGWETTNQRDSENSRYYAPAIQKKEVRPKSKNEYVYNNRDGAPHVKVTRFDDGNGHKKISQAHWNEFNWINGLGVDEAARARIKKDIPIYRYAKVREAIADGLPIFIVEGEGKADKLWKLGLAATTFIGGAGKYRAYGDSYLSDLEGAKVVLCPDRDTPGLKHMEDINKDFPDARWVYSPPSDFFWTHLPKSGGVDIADWIEGGATADDIMTAIEDRRVVVEHLDISFEKEDAERPAQIGKSKHAQNINLIRAYWGDRLRWNSMNNQVEFDGKRLSIDDIKTRVALEMDVDISREDAAEIVIHLAKRNSYSPVADYLNSLSLGDVAILDGLAAKYFGTPSPLHAAQLKRTLIAAVARALNPGCKVDTVCILQGAQGVGKSTFWSALAGEYFTDDLLSGTEKDEILKLSRYWLIEYAEIESAYRKKEISQLKAFLSRASDSVRRPYARDVESVPRPSIFVGTTNRDDFLNDPTGERRFWVIPVSGRIDTEQLKSERDRIWAAAVTAYKNGEQWYLTREEEQLLNAENQKYQHQDVWEPIIESYLGQRVSDVSIGNILLEGLQLEVARQDRQSQLRVAECLKRLGWEKGDRRSVGGKRCQMWQKKGMAEVWQGSNQDGVSISSNSAICHTSPGMAEVWQEVWQGSNQDGVSISEGAAIPAIPFSQKTFPEKEEVRENFTPPNDFSGKFEKQGYGSDSKTSETSEPQEVQTCHTSLPYLEEPPHGAGSTSRRDAIDDESEKVSTDIDTQPEELKPLSFTFKVGDRIRCYPTQRHAENKWAVRATVTGLETERGWFVGCTVEYWDKKKGMTTVRIFGGCSNWILSKE